MSVAFEAVLIDWNGKKYTEIFADYDMAKAYCDYRMRKFDKYERSFVSEVVV